MAQLVKAYDRNGKPVMVFDNELEAGEGRYLWAEKPTYETKEEKVKITPKKVVTRTKVKK